MWNKVWYIHTLKYYSTIKSNKLLISTESWISPKIFWVEEARPQMDNILRLHICKSLENANKFRSRITAVCLGIKLQTGNMVRRYSKEAKQNSGCIIIILTVVMVIHTYIHTYKSKCIKLFNLDMYRFCMHLYHDKAVKMHVCKLFYVIPSVIYNY